MTDFIKKKMMLLKLQEELEALEENEENAKQNAFLEDLIAVLDKHSYSMGDLKAMLESVEAPKRARSARGGGSESTAHHIEYNGHTYKVNAIGRQPAETKMLLDDLGLTPTEFLEQHK